MIHPDLIAALGEMQDNITKHTADITALITEHVNELRNESNQLANRIDDIERRLNVSLPVVMTNINDRLHTIEDKPFPKNWARIDNLQRRVNDLEQYPPTRRRIPPPAAQQDHPQPNQTTPQLPPPPPHVPDTPTDNHHTARPSEPKPSQEPEDPP